MSKKLLYGQDWFSVHEPVWREHLGHLLSLPIRILEVGSYEGRSAMWMLENFTLAHLTCVDSWDGLDPLLGEITKRAELCFDNNVADYSGRVTKIKSQSIAALSHMVTLPSPHNAFDLIYIDGNHEGLAALTDLTMAWQLLKVGGFLVFDDYRWMGDGLSVLPREAWDAFASMKPKMRLVHQFRQCIVERIG